jgi:hypothetical protein
MSRLIAGLVRAGHLDHLDEERRQWLALLFHLMMIAVVVYWFVPA